MKILFFGKIEYLEEWTTSLKELLPAHEIYIWSEDINPKDIDILLVWNQPHGLLHKFSNLQLIISLGAGVDHIMREPYIPPNVPIIRLVAKGLMEQMAEYITMITLIFQRRLLDYLALQNSYEWKYLPAHNSKRFTIGIMGLGVLGLSVAEKLKYFSFPLRAWTRTKKSIEGIECFYGDDQLHTFLNECNLLICLLPLTKRTEGILNYDTLLSLQKGAYLINAARGEHLVEDDLIKALDSDFILGACLDVFCNEPLPKEHQFWSHPKIIATPHISAFTLPSDVISQVVEAINRLEKKISPINSINLVQGY